MDAVTFFRCSRVLVVAGKGGVGKTTVTAAVAVAAARVGLDVLVVEVEGKRQVAATLQGAEAGGLGYDELVLRPADPAAGHGSIVGRCITAEAALADYLDTHGLRRLTRRLASSGALDVVATAAPGIEDILVLGKVKQLERAGAADLIVVDGPAAGHAITFLQAATALSATVSGGPIRTQAADVVELLGDPARCQVLLVTLAEETPVNELVETAFTLEDRVGVQLAPVVVNAVLDTPPVLAGALARSPAEAAAEVGVTLPPDEADALARAAAFRLARSALQAAQLDRLAEALPLPRLVLPQLFRSSMGPEGVDALADALLVGIAALPAPAASESGSA